MSYFFNYFLKRTTKPIAYHGLYNQGATDYLNSVLQVLYMTNDFREAVKRYQCDDPKGVDGCLKKLFQDLEKYTEYTYNITSALGIKTVMKQDDAAQCFEKILRNLTVPEASQIFQGELTYRNRCSGCGADSNPPEPFWSLPLELDHSDYSVMEAIDSYFHESTFSGPDQLYCETCETKCDATTKCYMTKAPEVLTLLLKRFKFDDYYNKFVKIPHTLERPEKYELYAFVEHSGDLKSGHYWATIKPPGDDHWYRFNDTTVSKLGFQPFQVDPYYRSDTAYLLFYRKRPSADTDPDEPGTSQSASSDNSMKHTSGKSSEREERQEAAGDMGLNVSMEQERCFDPGDSTLTFVDGEDQLDFLCEGFASKRALMSCGHAVTPMSLMKWCLMQLDQGESRFVCGWPGCDVKWPFEEVCKMALLTPDEIEHFKKNIKLNASKSLISQKCPGCLSTIMRKTESNLRTRCKSCSVRTGRTFEFCWQCLREWKGPRRRSDHCDHEDCHNPALRTLAVCPDMTFEHVSEVTGCPSIRACPTCGALLEHSKKNCKTLVCPRCKVKFCFVCLKLATECKRPYKTCKSGVAPRQTSIPVWKKE